MNRCFSIVKTHQEFAKVVVMVRPRTRAPLDLGFTGCWTSFRLKDRYSLRVVREERETRVLVVVVHVFGVAPIRGLPRNRRQTSQRWPRLEMCSATYVPRMHGKAVDPHEPHDTHPAPFIM